MKRPPYNRGPAGPWRDSGDRKQLLPEVDVNWRRRRQAPERSSGVAVPIVLTLGALIAVWYARTDRVAPVDPIQQPAPSGSADVERAQRVQAMSAQAEQARQAQLDAARAQAAESVSSINGKVLRRCVYQGSVSVQTSPCPPPWVEVAPDADSSRWQQVLEQEQMRLAADAKLAEEQRRYQEAIGGNPAPVIYSSQSGASQSREARCADAKAQRDQAYRIVGNQRTYDFIRHWDEIVYDACK